MSTTQNEVFGTFDYNTSTERIVFTCPAGHSAVVWEFSAMELSAGAHEIDLYVKRGGGTIFLAANTSLGYEQSVRYSGRYVLEAGDQLAVWQAGGSRANGYACGYLVTP